MLENTCHKDDSAVLKLVPRGSGESIPGGFQELAALI